MCTYRVEYTYTWYLNVFPSLRHTSIEIVIFVNDIIREKSNFKTFLEKEDYFQNANLENVIDKEITTPHEEDATRIKECTVHSGHSLHSKEVYKLSYMNRTQIYTYIDTFIYIYIYIYAKDD